MTDNSPEARAVRRRWINLGEFVAVAGLVISGLALWNSWSDGKADGEKTVAVEKARSVPIALRGTVENDGKTLRLSPVESAHALDSLDVSAGGKPAISVGSDGRLDADAVEALLPEGERKGTGTLSVKIAAHYVEAGTDKDLTRTYRLAYRWEGGGLFGHSLRLTGLRRG